MKTRIGDMLEQVTEGVILQQVNAQGVMKSGFAKAIREKWPRVWYEYSKQVKPKQADLGAKYMGQVIWVRVETDLLVANIVGQQFYGRKPNNRYTSYDALDIGLKSVAEFLRPNEATPIHFPMLGCGLGQANWNVVKALIKNNLKGYKQTLWKLEED